MEETSQSPLTVPDVIVRSSLQVFMAKKEDMIPVGFGSGCILQQAEFRQIVS